jgi:hypothetical protein
MGAWTCAHATDTDVGDLIADLQCLAGEALEPCGIGTRRLVIDQDLEIVIAHSTRIAGRTDVRRRRPTVSPSIALLPLRARPPTIQ